MRSDLRLKPEELTALVFPGQGAYGAGMLDPFREIRHFGERYARVCELVDDDPLARKAHDPGIVNRNVVSSLLTVLAGVSSLDWVPTAFPKFEPIAVAGYSVGQWTGALRRRHGRSRGPAAYRRRAGPAHGRACRGSSTERHAGGDRGTGAHARGDLLRGSGWGRAPRGHEP